QLQVDRAAGDAVRRLDRGRPGAAHGAGGYRARWAPVPLRRDRCVRAGRLERPARPTVLPDGPLPAGNRDDGAPCARAVPVDAPHLAQPPAPRATGPPLPRGPGRQDPLAPVDDGGGPRTDPPAQRGGCLNAGPARRLAVVLSLSEGSAEVALWRGGSGSSVRQLAG